jgi:hypothetical protein
MELILRTTVLPFSKVIITDKQLIDKEISSDLIVYELPIFIKNIIIEYNDIKVIHLCEDRQKKTSWGTNFCLYKDELLGLFEIETVQRVYTKIGRNYCFFAIWDEDNKFDIELKKYIDYEYELIDSEYYLDKLKLYKENEL